MAALTMVAAAEAQADEAKRLAYGKHLSGECSSCHRIDGVDNGIPSITGWPGDDFVATMEFYRTGARPNPAMVSVAKSLDEDQIRALAAYYGSLPKPAKAKK
jgi:cytochrome c